LCGSDGYIVHNTTENYLATDTQSTLYNTMEDGVTEFLKT